MRYTLVLLLLCLPATADAGRWKSGTAPAGSGFQQRGPCYYNPNESGTNQCRWKVMSTGCTWTLDSGNNQCSPGRWKSANGGCWFVVNDLGPNQCTPPVQAEPLTVYVNEKGWTGYVTVAELDGQGATIDGTLALSEGTHVITAQFRVYPDGTPSILAYSVTRSVATTYGCLPHMRYYDGTDCCDTGAMHARDRRELMAALRFAYRSAIGAGVGSWILTRPIPAYMLAGFVGAFSGYMITDFTMMWMSCGTWW